MEHRLVQAIEKALGWSGPDSVGTADNFLTIGGERRGKAVRMADIRKLADLLETGCTVILDALDLLDPSMEVACRALQWWSGDRVQVNVYLTTQDTAGFGLHWDDHDVLVVQLAGSKTWEVRGTSSAGSTSRCRRSNTPLGISTDVVAMFQTYKIVGVRVTTRRRAGRRWRCCTGWRRCLTSRSRSARSRRSPRSGRQVVET